MSLQDYQISREIEAKDYPFYSLLMAAMSSADDNNFDILKQAFPGVEFEMRTRSQTPCGHMEGGEE